MSETKCDPSEGARALEERLAMRERELRELERVACLGSWVWDVLTQRLTCSAGAHRVLGLVPETALDLDALYQRVDQADRPALDHGVQRILAGERELALDLHVESGTGPMRVMHVRALVDERDARYVVGSIQDVTEQRRTLDELTQREAQYRLLAESATDLVALWQPDGWITYVSPSVQRLLGFQASALVGRPAGLLMHPEDVPDFNGARASLLCGGDTATVTVRAQHFDGHWIWLELGLRAMRDARTGELLEIRVAGRDVGERMQAEEELARRAQTLEALNERLRNVDRYKDEFLGMLSHELRAPLNAIMGFSALLAEHVKGPLSPDQQHFVEKILDNADGMLVMIEDLLDQARMQAGHFKVFPRPARYAQLLDAATGRIEALALRKHLTLVAEGAPDVTLMLDEARILQVLVNLLSNAIKFTPARGRVTLRARLEGAYVVTEVEDNGPGITLGDQALIFKPFFQLEHGLARTHGGAGLGLGICKTIIEAHGGEIGVHSHPGSGSLFWFRLPLGTPDAP